MEGVRPLEDYRLGFSATERKTARGDAQETKDSIGKSLYPAARRSVSSISHELMVRLGLGRRSLIALSKAGLIQRNTIASLIQIDRRIKYNAVRGKMNTS